MTGDAALDHDLQQRFEAVKALDARRAPAFGEMLQRARQEAAAVSAPDVQRVRVRPASNQHRATRRRIMLWAGPLAIAAGLGAIYLFPVRNAESAADREFDRLVTEWTRTAAATSHAPTDGLLAVPGSELLGTMPSLGSGVGPLRGRS